MREDGKGGEPVRPGAPVAGRGLALGGDKGVRPIDVSIDGSATWNPASLRRDEGISSFRQWTAHRAFFRHPDAARSCTNTAGVSQPMERGWTTNGFMQNGIERLGLAVAA